MESYIFTSTLREFLRFRRIAAWIIVVFALYGIGVLYLNVDAGINKQDAYTVLSAALVFKVLPLAATIFSTAIIAQEVEQRTIVYLLTRPVPRWKLIVFRTLAAVVVVFLISALAAVATSFAVYHGTNPFLLRDIKAIGAGSFAYVSLFVFVSLLLNRSMIACLIFAFAWETSVSNLPGDLYRITITSYLSSIAQRPSAGAESKNNPLGALGGMFGQNSISMSTAWISIAVITAVSLAACAWWFTNFEFTAREDGE